MPRGVPNRGSYASKSKAPNKNDGIPHRVLRQPLAALRLAKGTLEWLPVVITESKRSYETFSVFEARREGSVFFYSDAESMATLTLSEIKAILAAVPAPGAPWAKNVMLPSGIIYSSMLKASIRLRGGKTEQKAEEVGE